MNGMRRFRIALILGAITPGFELIRYVFKGIAEDWWSRELGGIFVAASLFGTITLALTFYIAWRFGYRCIMYLTHLTQEVLAPSVSRSEWDRVTNRLWIVLPYASGCGVLTWLVYSIGNFGGWPDDMIFGIVGNVIGAACYLPLLFGWGKLRFSVTSAKAIESP
jgi:hypothetical protein